MQLHKVQIKRIIGPTPNGAAVLLGNEEKTFVIFVGFYEAAALIREVNGETPARPLTHELLQNVFLGFDIEVRQIIVSTIIENTFCATLILQQKLFEDTEGQVWTGRRNEVRIDARPSDCLVLALKNKIEIHVTDEVFQSVQDVSQMTADVEKSLAGMLPTGEADEIQLGEGFSDGRPGGFDEDDEDDDEANEDDDEANEDDEPGGFEP